MYFSLSLVLSLSLFLSSSLSFCWSCHVFFITLIKCFKGQKSQRSLFKGVNVIVFVFVFVVVFLLVRSCFLMIPISFAKMGFGLADLGKIPTFSRFFVVGDVPQSVSDRIIWI